jgi:cyclopropane fatty-acyl-phospholipid synthase-like methyltransferase
VFLRGIEAGRPAMSARTSYAERDGLLAAALGRMKPADTVLDIGCGINPQSYIHPFLHICCEPSAEYVGHLRDRLRERQDRVWVVLNMDWRGVVEHIPPGSVDSIFLVDVIEHLEKEPARELLAKTLALAPRQVILFTPLGFMPQHHENGRDAWGLGGVSWQEHRSGWTPEDFDETWEAVVCKDYHQADNLNRPLKDPFGAFWAIWTNPKAENAEAAKPSSEAARWREVIAAINRSADARAVESARQAADLAALSRCVAELQKELGVAQTMYRRTLEGRVRQLFRGQRGGTPPK